ncbi:hypothetical protein AAW12_00580 [Sphingobacterium sp. Ag1]|nr:hypothetical protein AAW12_00580 [Sphingobacterium sp. Ag1]
MFFQQRKLLDCSSTNLFDIVHVYVDQMQIYRDVKKFITARRAYQKQSYRLKSHIAGILISFTQLAAEVEIINRNA